MINVAILGFGVVGGGTAELIAKNEKELTSLCGDTVNVKRILDLRDFPDSPFCDRITHDFNDILDDPEISVVAEVMGGSHPAYEFTMALLKSGKSVVTSNKEVVANYGDEFLALARENGVSYCFEASVGGGIPLISPIINCVRQNKITEVRGILNGTTNYILTQMFTYGESFETALASAQKNGYCEKNPDADILGLDACRKIVILAALVTGNLYSPDDIYTEGITKIRKADVAVADKLGLAIKLVPRCILDGEKIYVMVAPFMVSDKSSLISVNGVYNAAEIIGAPIGNVMLYGRGAGADATSSAVVADIVQSATKASLRPSFKKGAKPSDISDLKSRRYFAVEGDKAVVEAIVGAVDFIESDECAFLTEEISEAEAERLIADMKAASIGILSSIRLL